MENHAEPTIDHFPLDEAHSDAIRVAMLRASALQLPAVSEEADPSTVAGPPKSAPGIGAEGLPRPASGPPSARYRLIGEIGRGGMGAVVKGRDSDLGRDIAVKFILEDHLRRPELVQRFVEEARITGQLQHPGIVPVYELGQFPDQRLYFTMKLVDGQTLGELLGQRAEFSQDRPRFLKIFEQICQTLSYAHARGVIHRDLKPANIMVGAFGEVQVMDWGLAKVLQQTNGEAADQLDEKDTGQSSHALGDARSVDSRTQAGSVLGTPAYMAPEQACGEVPRLDETSDVFGLGAILCEILTGCPPYIGDRKVKVHERAARADLTDASARLDQCGADAELVRLAKRCLSAAQSDRPRNAGALAAELAAYLNSVEQRLRQAELAGVAARAREEEERKRREVTVAAQQELRRALTRQVAERLEGELGRLEMVGRSLAALVAQRNDWDEAQLAGWMNTMLQYEELIFGLFVAFEPGAFRPDVADYGLYQFRGGPLGECVTKILGPPDYPYRDFDWYQKARETGEARWTEPFFFDADGGDIPMVCYTVPIRRNGRFAGIVNVDLSIRYFERLGGWLRELDFGQRSYEFVVSRLGLIISHPLPEYDFATLAATDKPPRNIGHIDGADERLVALTRRMLSEESGSGLANDPSTGGPATWLFERVRPAGWTFVAVVDQGDAC